MFKLVESDTGHLVARYRSYTEARHAWRALGKVRFQYRIVGAANV